MSERTRFEGMWRIVRFNWPLYAAATAVLFVCFALLIIAEARTLKIVAAVACGGAVWFLLGSLGVSHIVYDRSDLHRGEWLGKALAGTSPGRGVVCHCGYDEISALVRRNLPGTELQILDHYDQVAMSEPSIHRARALYPQAIGAISTPFAKWPLENSSLDLVLGVLAIHELRKHEERGAWFAEARRCISGEGRVVLVEHLRDFASFSAFGPGFFHFHTAGTWRRAWEWAGMRMVDEFNITPFLRVFVLCRHHG